MEASAAANRPSADPHMINPGATVSGTAYSDRNHVPASRKLSESVSPDTYYGCPGNPLKSGKACYDFAGGWSTDFDQLEQCDLVTTETCGPKPDQKIGDAFFIWNLSPTYFHKTK